MAHHRNVGREFNVKQHVHTTIAEMARGGEPTTFTVDDLVRLLHGFGLKRVTSESAPDVAYKLLANACERGAFAADDIEPQKPSLQHLLLAEAANTTGDAAELMDMAARMINALNRRGERYEAQIAVMQGRVQEGTPTKEA